jgi:hypothetical protein
MSTPEKIGEIAMIFLAFRDQLKLYHWVTLKYSRHKASDQLVTTITEQMDKFIETIQGSRNIRLKLSDKNKKITFENMTDSNIVDLLVIFKNWLIEGLPKYLNPSDKDLSNIRDEILGSVDQSIYLFSLD